MLTGAFAFIDATMIEWHHRLAKLEDRKNLSKNLQVQETRLSFKTVRTFKINSEEGVKADYYIPTFSQAGLHAMTSISPLVRHLDLDDESYGFEHKPLPKC